MRKTVYNSGQFDPSFDEPDYAMVDTLFSLAEAYLFMQLVELKVLGEGRGGGGGVGSHSALIWGGRDIVFFPSSLQGFPLHPARCTEHAARPPLPSFRT